MQEQTHEPKPSTEILPEPKLPGLLETWDRALFRALYFGTRNSVFNVLMPFLSIVANRGAVHIIAGSLMIYIGRMGDDVHMQQAGAVMMIAAMFAGILAEGTVKFIWKRLRPFQAMDDVMPLVPARRLKHRPSFPSGHSAGYLAAVVTVTLFFPYTGFVLVPLGILGSFSRIYNGVHYPSDVMAGMLLGAGCAFLAFYLIPPFF